MFGKRLWKSDVLRKSACQWTASLLKYNSSTDDFQAFLLVKTNYLVSTLAEHWLKMGLKWYKAVKKFLLKKMAKYHFIFDFFLFVSYLQDPGGFAYKFLRLQLLSTYMWFFDFCANF